VGSSYLLSCAVIQPFVVNISDVFGRQLFLLLSLLLFTVGTIVCCLSPNFTQLLIGRSIQGIGGGGCIPLIQVIITDIVPLRHRPTYLIFPAISWSVASITGPLIGGLFSDHTTWRWIFYINFPFCALGIIMTLFAIKMDYKLSTMRLAQRVAVVDWFGGGLLISSTCSILIGITWGGCRYDWTSGRTLAPMIVGLCGIIATIIWEVHASRPFLPLELFKSRSGAAACFCAFIQGLLVSIS
jgi:MFS family permease